ncbi:hypothetical protein [Dactylosporangium salmoneum]|uniref:Uncharacterized protein n=1 Tax=Dactylosporangium salmoneum TaxID=53361 RepID=A0ABN3FD00_9ACTN
MRLLARREAHPEWCAQGHACGLGEHRSDPHVVDVPGAGRIVVVRVLGRDGSEHAEVRGTVRLPSPEVVARKRLLKLLHDVVTALGR